MSNITVGQCSLAEISAEEMQIRGGSLWKEIFKLARYLKFITDFIQDYKDDMERGFKKGWRSL